MEKKLPGGGLDSMEKALRLDREREERMRQREIANKNKTPEQIERERLADEKMADIDKVLDGLMTKEEFKI